MGDDITIGVTEIVNNIEVTAQPNDQIVDISVIDNADDVTLNITPTVIEINVNKGSSYAKWGDILGTLSDQTDLQSALDLKANLVGGKVPASELPSYVDDVVEVADYAALPATGETGKIYVTLDNNKIYRWSGSTYIEIAANNAIWGAITGTLSSQTDLQAALDAKQDDLISGTNIKTIEGQSLLGSGNIDLTKSDVGLSNVDNTSDANKPISTATQTALDAKQNTITLTTTGTSGSSTLVGSTLNIPNYTTDISGLVPYTGATANVDLGTHKLTASDLVVNHASGSGVAASITKGGNGEALTVLKTSGSGNAASILGGITLLDELHLNTDLADAYIASAATWNAKQNALTFSSPLVNTSGTILIPAASGSVNGYLSSADWTTFNNKVESVAATLPLGSTGGTSPVISITQATTSSNGYLSSTDWNTFNGKQTALSGTGFVKISGTTISYDNSTYVPTSRTLTINGTAYDLSADRSWTISGLPSMLEYNDTDKTVWNNGKGNFSSNTSFGDGALKNNSSGTSTTAYGNNALRDNSSGNSNTALGVGSLISNSTGSNNVAIGQSAGQTYQNISTSIFIGNSTAATSESQSNVIVIGHNAVGNGSNSVTLGNSSITKTVLYGNVGIGTTSPSALLHLATSSGNGSAMRFESTSTNGRTYGIGSNFATGNGEFAIYDYTANAERMRITSSGNVGIGTTSPAEKLEVVTSGAYTTIYTGANGNGASGLACSSDNRANTWFVGSRKDIYGGTSGTDRFNILYGTNAILTASTGGNVGIGTTSPLVKFVNSGATLAPTPTLGSGSIGANAILSANGLYGLYTGVSNTGDVWQQVQRNDANTAVYNLLLQPSGGNVGIGTTSPSGKLTISGVDAGCTIDMFNTGISQKYRIVVNTLSGALAFENNSGTETVRFNQNGNVGIGTTSPNYSTSGRTVVDINGTSQSMLALSVGGVGKSFLFYTGTDLLLSNESNGAIKLNTNGSQKMVIEAGGNVGIGTTSPSYKLDVAGVGRFLGLTPLTLERSGSTKYTFSLGASNDFYINNVNIGTTPLTILSSGNVGIGTLSPSYTLHVNGSVAGTSAYNNLSDKRYKKDILPIQNALDKILALNGVTFNWDKEATDMNLDDNNHIGLLAQDVEEILPQAVTTGTDENKTKSVAYTDLVPVLIEAIKELKAEIEILKTK